MSVRVEFTPNVCFSVIATADEMGYDFQHAAIRFNDKNHKVFNDSAEETVDSILKMYKFLNLTDVPVSAFVDVAYVVLDEASDCIDSFSKEQLNSCIPSTTSSPKRNLDSESGDEPPSKKQKVDN